MRKKLAVTMGVFLIVLIILLPTWLLVIQALLPSIDAMMVTQYMMPIQLFTTKPVLEQFTMLFSGYSTLSESVMRSFIFSFLAACVQCLVSIPGGYVLAKYPGWLTRWIALFYTLTLVVPVRMYLIPFLRSIERLELSGISAFSYCFIAFSPLGAILTRQILLKMPDEYVAAFRLENSRTVNLFSHVVIPVGKPVFEFLFLFSFSEAWSMVEQPLILLSDKNHYPFSLIIGDLRTRSPGVVFAASVLALLPMIIFYLGGFLNRRIRSLR